MLIAALLLAASWSTGAAEASPASPENHGGNVAEYHWRFGGCAPDAVDGHLHGNIRGRVWMKEIGRHGIVRFRVTYNLYPAATTPRITTPLRTRTYISPRFLNDNRSNAQWLPSTGMHIWRGLPTGERYRLEANLTWVRRFASDFNATVVIGRCTIPGGPPPT